MDRATRIGCAIGAAIAATILAAGSGPAAAATVLDAKTVTITSALNDVGEPYYNPGDAYIQVSEVVADNFSATDVALSSNGGTATAASNYQGSDYTGKAIDGIYPQEYSDIYHSAGTGTGEFLTISFSSPEDLSSLSIYGRGTTGSPSCCTERDVYNYSIFNSAGALITSGQLDARNLDHVATIDFDAPGGVPEPAAWALMIGGFGLAGAALRRQRAQVAA
ncbi:PEPxxWA-CTERM sorting domain-containing protein [Phenylobacterium sp.]|uniref:PEPxxWA-CTERM sorting domain-containing protein n=1 Tax=Phenylobacterium sp. TaxID=1871053 RepID=UPI001206AD22|nr:PEPxxWA-CTERM sorting domain-containing protein [Phenylobacterium sp.]THD65304.1 MAG: PEP-CTERM sorting domain-containing protein [Phenylobacterium sp.]